MNLLSTRLDVALGEGALKRSRRGVAGVERRHRRVFSELRHDGARVNEGSTPATLGMEDGDVIDVMVSMEGGGTDNPKKRRRALT